METRLLTFQAHLDPARLDQQIPPSCRARAAPALHWQSNPDKGLRFSLELPPHLLEDVDQIIPCFACTSPRDYGYRFSLSVRTPQGEVATCSLSPIGRLVPGLSKEDEEGPVSAQIDVFALRQPLASATLELCVFPEDPEAFKNSPALLSVSVSDRQEPAVKEDAPPAADAQVDIPVPLKSQMLQDPEIARRICSPTSVSMVLDHYGIQTEPVDLARLTYHPQHDLYGVWPAGVYAASRWGLLGYILKFPSWAAAQWLLDCGIPFIASIRFDEGELTDAPIPRTSGHLVVVRGYCADKVAVNDPAADSIAGVRRLYPREEFARVWLTRSAAGYVLFPAPAR